jgi:hypothetical protein
VSVAEGLSVAASSKWLLVAAVVLACGCGKPAPPAAPAVAVEDEPYEPCEVELSDAKVTLAEPGVAKFEVKYRFTKGKPAWFYSCEVTFPGTANRAVKRMQNWELKSEGVIVDRVALKEKPVKVFEISLSEAPSGRDAYKKISNVVKGAVE